MSDLTVNWLSEIPAAYVRCRSLGHAWIEGGDMRFRLARGHVGRALTCERCQMVRVDLYDSNSMELIKRRYSRPLDYDKPKGLERPMGVEITAEFFARAATAKAADLPEVLKQLSLAQAA